MPAPKRANTSAATIKAAEVARRRGNHTKAAALTKVDWICLPPEAYQHITINLDATRGVLTIQCLACSRVIATYGGRADRLDTLLADIINHRGKVAHDV